MTRQEFCRFFTTTISQAVACKYLLRRTQFCAMVSLTFLLMGCERTALPESYGVYIKDGKKFTRLESSVPDAQRQDFSPSMTIVIFDRRLSLFPGKLEEIAKVLPRRRIRFNVEKVHDKRGAPPTDIILTKTDETGVFDDPVPCDILPVQGKNDMVELRPRTPLSHGLYYLDFAKEREPFGVAVGSEGDEAASGKAVDRYFDTTTEKAGFSMDSLKAATDRGLSNLDYRGSNQLEKQYYRDTEALDREVVEWRVLAERASKEKRFGDCKRLLARLEAYDGKISALRAQFIEAVESSRETPKLDLGAGVSMELVLIPAGEFLMGSPANEEGRSHVEGPQHRVTITKAYYLGKYEVTKAQWEAVMGNNPSAFKGCPDCPVEQVSWDDAQAYTKKLSEKTGRTIRLPTEAEWEYACRAGTTTPFHTGLTISTLQANYNGDEPKGENLKRTTKVGSFLPNAFGLYDMHGNVFEWCSDWHGEKYYSSSPGTDPTGPTTGEKKRVIRGGSWNYIANNSRCATRDNKFPNLEYNNLGFRLAVDSK